jgi:hypothetical protein
VTCSDALADVCGNPALVASLGLALYEETERL